MPDQPITGERRVLAWTAHHPFLLAIGLYAVVAAIFVGGYPLLPGPLRLAADGLIGNRTLGIMDAGTISREAALPVQSAAPLWASGILSMSAAALLSLPIAWIYTITRQKRGYRQSVVHSLILLPVVVAGVVVLVKHSLALAFSLAGIVAAVRFRNTLEDSKDAVYIFVVTGVGLACGVELPAAAAMSVFFNLITLLLFQSDFGRTPARLEGEIAEQKMRRALAMSNRTGQFVARLDSEILENLAPAQLEALADRAWRRRKETTTDEHADDRVRYDTALSVKISGSHVAREAVELILSRYTKRWRFENASIADDGAQQIEYRVRLRKSIQPTAFMDALRKEGEGSVLDVALK